MGKPDQIQIPVATLTVVFDGLSIVTVLVKQGGTPIFAWQDQPQQKLIAVPGRQMTYEFQMGPNSAHAMFMAAGIAGIGMHGMALAAIYGQAKAAAKEAAKDGGAN